MSKNLTRKGLAFGALVALASTVIAGAPANALTGNVVSQLNSGTSYNTLAGTSYDLKLKTDITSGSWTASKLKYRVTNPDARAIIAKYAVTGTAVALPSNSASTGYIKKYSDATAITLSSDATTSTDFLLAPANTNYAGVTSASNVLSLSTSYVDGNTSVTVVAWIDENGNDAIDEGTEYVGNSQTVNFIKPSNVVATTTLTAPVLGSATVTATTTTVPELNGEQLGANAISVGFTAQGNANEVLAQNTTTDGSTMGSNTYSGTTKKWTATGHLAYSLTGDRWTGTDSALADLNLATAPYTYTSAAATNITLGKVAHGVTAGTGVTHIAVFGMTTAAGAKTAKIATVANVDFATSADAISITTTGATSGTSANLTAGTLRKLVAGANATVVAGSYAAKAYVGATAISGASASGVVAATAADTKATVVASTTNTGGENTDATANSNAGLAVSVLKGTTSGVATSVAFLKSDATAVAAGIAATATVSGVTGTVTVNGTKVADGDSVALTTDAAGKVTATVASSTAANGDGVKLVFSAEGLAGSTAAAVTFAWANPTYSLVDLKDAGTTNTARVVATGGSVAFDLALVNQFGGTLASSDYRAVVTAGGRTVSSTTHLLTAGKTTVTVADNGLGAGSTITVDVDIEKLASGTWGADDLTATAGAVEEWASGDSSRRTITVITAATAAVQLNASTATTYGGSAADFAGNINTTALTAVDNRISGVKNTQTATTNISGNVVNAATLVARGGATVTVTGPSSVFFKVGDVYGKGSLTFIASSTGVFNIEALSNIAQTDSVITVTSEGASKTVKVSFAGVASTSGTVLSIDAPSVNKSGRTLTFRGKLVDKFGNAVATAVTANNGTPDFKVAYDGPGFATATLPIDTETDGTFTVRIVLASDDAGLATLKATYGGSKGAYDATVTGETADIVVSKAVLIGVSASVSKAATSKVTVKNASGLTVKVVRGTKSVTKTATSDSYKVSLKGGSGSVKVYVEGILVATKK